jgi:DNA-binding response OmpR family regulator
MPPLCTPFAIAIVEDEPVLREDLAFFLREHGYQVHAFSSAGAFYRHLAVHRVAAVILDIGLPGEDGLSICRHLRAHDKQMGILFVTARGQRGDRLTGLQGGADAYLVKPVDLDELMLILGRLCQRVENATQPPLTESSATVAPSWMLTTARARLTAPNGEGMDLTLSEFQLLKTLQAHAPQPCSPLQLGMALGQATADEFDKHRIEVLISRLRLKVRRTTAMELPIRSCRNQGYRIEPLGLT